VQLRCFAGHRHLRVIDNGQILVLHRNQIAGLGGNGFGFGNDDSHIIADEADNIAPLFVGAGAAQHRLGRHLQAVLVDGHIGGGEDIHDAGKSSGGPGIDTDHAGVHSPGKQYF
jgi:hypothetical protein